MSTGRRTSGRKRRRPTRYGLDVEVYEPAEVDDAGAIRLLTPVVEDEPGSVVFSVRDAETQTDDDGVERRHAREREFLGRELRDSLIRETSHCAALAASERARAESEREIARLALELTRSRRG